MNTFSTVFRFGRIEPIPKMARKRKTTEYSFLESCFGGRLLILDGFSFRRKSMTSGKSYWFCCSSKCPARGILRADGEFQITNCAHNHSSDSENIKRKEKLVELKKLALEVNASGQELLEALNIKNDIKKHLNFIRTCRRRDKNLTSSETPLQVGLNYKLLPSRISSKEMLLHSGYLFRKDSVNPHNDKLKYWRCRVKNCKARAKTDDHGNLTILKLHHSHPSEESEEKIEYFEQTGDTKTSHELARGAVSEHRVKRDYWKIRRQKHTGKESALVEEANSSFCTPTTDSETFSFEKLMAETLAENYCVTTDYNEPFNC